MRHSPFATATPWIALALAGGFLASLSLGVEAASSHQDASGPLHASIALATAAVAVWHLLRHRSWLRRVLRSAATLAKPQRLRRIAGILVGALFLFMVVTGILSSRFLGLDPAPFVVGLHHVSAKLTLLVVIWHLVLCRQQIVHWFRRPPAASATPPEATGGTS